MDTTYQTLLLYVILPLVGIGLIVFALVWGKRLGRQPVEIGLAKLGVNLKSDTLTLLILVGFLMACVGVFFQYKGYETRVTDLQKELEQAESQIKDRDAILQSFKAYSMSFLLVFPETDTVDAEQIEVEANIAKQGKGTPETSPLETEISLDYQIWINIDDLNPGDKLCIVAREGEEKEWESSRVMEIPVTELQMRRVK